MTSITITGKLISFEDFISRFAEIELGEAETFRQICDMRIETPEAAACLRSLDPFSREYRDVALSIYEFLKGSRGYSAEDDEQNSDIDMAKLFTETNPWSIKSPSYLGEFLQSWAHIVKLLNVEAGQSVLEYGPGSGEILLMLARVGVDAYGVDINPMCLEAIRRRADVMNTHVSVEKGRFGGGFEGRRFDRILFFEAFHHAFDFLDVLNIVKHRLNPEGFIVFCGEPVLGEMTDSVPYPWGPRLDGLTVHTIQKYGWMELGFTHEFFVEALRRTGYDVTFHNVVDCGRAVAYTARPGTGQYFDANAPLPPVPPVPPPPFTRRQRLKALFTGRP